MKDFEKGALIAPLIYKWLIEQLAKVFHYKNSVAKQKHFFEVFVIHWFVNDFWKMRVTVVAIQSEYIWVESMGDESPLEESEVQQQFFSA